MQPIAHQLVLRLEDDRVIAPTKSKRLLAARLVLSLATPYRLVAFALVDTHLHMILLCTRAEAGRLLQQLKLSLRHHLQHPVRFAAREPQPLEDAWHLYNAVRYVLRQFEKHGFQRDLLYLGSNLQDLLGLRVLAPYARQTMTEHLPRIADAELWKILGPPGPLIAGGPLHHLVEAATAACGLSDLRSPSTEARDARRAVVAVAGDRLPTTKLAAVLGIDRRSVARLRRRAPRSTLVRAIGLQLGLLHWFYDEGGETIIRKRRELALLGGQ